MDLEAVSKTILDLKEDIEESVQRNENCENFLQDTLGKSPEKMPNKHIELWKFAFEHARNWNNVVEKLKSYKRPYQVYEYNTNGKGIESSIKSDRTTNVDETSKLKIKNKNLLREQTSLVTEIVYQEIEKAIIVIEFNTKEVYDEFSAAKDIELYDNLFRRFVHSQCENGVWSSEPKSKHLIPHTINLTDVYGQWEKDLFFGHLKIFVKSLEEKKSNFLPKSWRTNESKLNQFSVERILKCKESALNNLNNIENNNDDENDLNLAKMDVATFIRKFLVKHNRLKYEKQLQAQINRMYVNTVHDLINLPAHSWESMQQHHNLGPIITPLLKKDIEQLRLNTKSTGKKVKDKSLGEILADIHKIKRFLFYETKAHYEKDKGKRLLIDKMAYLSKKALRLGFEEQKKDEKFDGGPVMNKIQSYLEENFATPELPEIIKPSHGMILV